MRGTYKSLYTHKHKSMLGLSLVKGKKRKPVEQYNPVGLDLSQVEGEQQKPMEQYDPIGLGLGLSQIKEERRKPMEQYGSVGLQPNQSQVNKEPFVSNQIETLEDTIMFQELLRGQKPNVNNS